MLARSDRSVLLGLLLTLVAACPGRALPDAGSHDGTLVDAAGLDGSVGFDHGAGLDQGAAHDIVDSATPDASAEDTLCPRQCDQPGQRCDLNLNQLQVCRADDAGCTRSSVEPCAHGCIQDQCRPAAPPATGTWVHLPAGSFVMGSPEDELGRFEREHQHNVTLTRDFALRSTQVTQEEWSRLMGYNPSQFPACGAGCPVESFSWHEAAAFCNALSDDAGVTRCYTCSGERATLRCAPSAEHLTPFDCPGVRLPTEAEWEYAARAGSSTSSYNGDVELTGCGPSAVLSPIAWHCGNSDAHPHEVGTRLPNLWGLYDMVGNVYEWCHDWYQEPLLDANDPWGPADGSQRILRGGSWDRHVQYQRAAYRSRYDPTWTGGHLGLRPAQTLP